MLTAIGTMVIIAFLLRDYIAVETLFVPDKWGVTNPEERGWLINPIENLEAYQVLGAIIPALLVGLQVYFVFLLLVATCGLHMCSYLAAGHTNLC